MGRRAFRKQTLAEGFTPPPGAEKKFDILPISVGTDPNLALKTRRGTGYYKAKEFVATLPSWFTANVASIVQSLN